VNGTLHSSVNGKDQSFNPITQTTLTGLQTNTDYTIEVKAYGREGYLYANHFRKNTK
jgi:chitodextrinase